MMDRLPLAFWAVVAGLFGLLVGSFLNVCIWRIPSGEQIVRGRSHCRQCGRTILWFDNIPVLSYCLLKGRCRFCHAKIEWTYPFVEAMTGLWFAFVVVWFKQVHWVAVYGLLGAILILLAMIDIKEMLLPDSITLPGLSMGVILSYYFPSLHAEMARWAGLWESVKGALVGAGAIWLIRVVGGRIFRKEAMGLGDVKMMAMVGAFIGMWKVLLVIFILAPILGSVVGLILKFRYGQEIIPYGPFLAIGTVGAILWGDAILAWYRSWLML